MGVRREQFTENFMRRYGPLALLIWLALLFAIGWGFFAPMSQPEAYHRFADTRVWLGIPNFGDVISNAALLVVGLAGVVMLWPHRAPGLRAGPPQEKALSGKVGVGGDSDLAVESSTVFANGWEARCFLIFFLALALTGIGSTWYHWAPDTPRLFWDRLPLSAIIMLLPPALLAGSLGLIPQKAGTTIADAQQRSARWKRSPFTLWAALALVVWVASGPLSILYWHVEYFWNEEMGAGDLRPYAVTQAAALTVTAAFLTLLSQNPLPQKRLSQRPGEWRTYLAAMVLYALARLTEHFDTAIFSGSGVISGHTLKHLFAALAAALLLSMLLRRTTGPSRHPPSS